MVAVHLVQVSNIIVNFIILIKVAKAKIDLLIIKIFVYKVKSLRAEIKENAKQIKLKVSYGNMVI